MITLIATLKIKEGKVEEAINALKRSCRKLKQVSRVAWNIYPTLSAVMKTPLLFMRNIAIKMP